MRVRLRGSVPSRQVCKSLHSGRRHACVPGHRRTLRSGRAPELCYHTCTGTIDSFVPGQNGATGFTCVREGWLVWFPSWVELVAVFCFKLGSPLGFHVGMATGPVDGRVVQDRQSNRPTGYHLY